MCERNGWEIEAEITDRDIGASRHTKHGYRPGYEQLRRTLRPGQVLVMWETSRISRRLQQYVDIRDLCSELGSKWCIGGRTYDLSDPADRMALTFSAAVAENEADEIRRRAMRGIKAHAEAGKPSSKVPYGYRAVRDEHSGKLIGWRTDPETAVLVRQWADYILSGGSAYTLSTRLNKDGLPSPTGIAWRPATLRQMLARPVYAGIRRYKGRDIPGTWEPLWDIETHDRLVVALSAKTPGRPTFGRAPSTLLSAVGVCGKCKAKLSASSRSTVAKPSYTCSSVNSCVYRRIDLVDGLVAAAVVEFFGTEAGRALAKRDRADDEQARAFDTARQLQARLDEAADDYADEKIDRDTFHRIRDRITPKLEAAWRQAESSPEPTVGAVDTDDPQRYWDELTLIERRVLVASLFDVAVLPIPEGQSRKVFDPDLVKITLKKFPTD